MNARQSPTKNRNKISDHVRRKKNVDEKTIKYTNSHVHTKLINDKYLMFDNTGNVTFAVGATSIL